MQSLTQTWYLTCGKSREHTIFFASLKLVGQVFPLGRRSFQNVMFSSKHVSIILCFTFISRAMSATFRREIVSCIIIIFGRFFFFSPVLGAIAPLPAFFISYCCPATVD